MAELVATGVAGTPARVPHGGITAFAVRAGESEMTGSLRRWVVVSIPCFEDCRGRIGIWNSENGGWCADVGNGSRSGQWSGLGRVYRLPARPVLDFTFWIGFIF